MRHRIALFRATLSSRQITEALTNARGEDAKKIKELIPLERDWSPTLIGERKEARGFAHVQVAQVLCPPHDLAFINTARYARPRYFCLSLTTRSVHQEYVNRLRPMDGAFRRRVTAAPIQFVEEDEKYIWHRRQLRHAPVVTPTVRSWLSRVQGV